MLVGLRAIFIAIFTFTIFQPNTAHAQSSTTTAQDRYIMLTFGSLPDGFIAHPKFKDATSRKSIRSLEGLALLEQIYAAKDYRAGVHLGESYFENSRSSRTKENAAQIDALQLKGTTLLEDMADRGYSRAMLQLSKNLMDGHPVFNIKKDRERALQYKRMAAQAGDPIGMYELGRREDGWTEKAANAGHVESMLLMYFRYSDGVDDAKADKYLKMAFETGDNTAYGIYVKKGLATKKPKSAITKFLEAQGTSKETPLLHYSPEKQREYIAAQRAIADNQRAADQRLKDYTVKLQGPLLPVQDGFTAFEAGRYDDARRILSRHASLGDGDAQNVMGIIYWDGLSVPKNETAGENWFRDSAASGSPGGQYHLGSMIYHGWSSKSGESIATAKMWLNRAAAGGAQPAKDLLANIAEAERQPQTTVKNIPRRDTIQYRPRCRTVYEKLGGAYGQTIKETVECE